MISSPIRLATRALLVITAVLTVSASRVQAQDSVDWKAYKKQVEAGQGRDTIPQNAYQGWKQFELNCARCHGEYGVGTSFAPALIVSLKDGGTVPNEAAFIAVVCQGRKDKGMPSWCELGLEMDKIQNIYAYLKLRADGKVAAGRPAVKADG